MEEEGALEALAERVAVVVATEEEAVEKSKEERRSELLLAEAESQLSSVSPPPPPPPPDLLSGRVLELELSPEMEPAELLLEGRLDCLPLLEFLLVRH